MAGPALDIEEVLRRYSQIFGTGRHNFVMNGTDPGAPIDRDQPSAADYWMNDVPTFSYKPKAQPDYTIDPVAERNVQIQTPPGPIMGRYGPLPNTPEEPYPPLGPGETLEQRFNTQAIPAYRPPPRNQVFPWEGAPQPPSRLPWKMPDLELPDTAKSSFVPGGPERRDVSAFAKPFNLAQSYSSPTTPPIQPMQQRPQFRFPGAVASDFQIGAPLDNTPAAPAAPTPGAMAPILPVPFDPFSMPKGNGGAASPPSSTFDPSPSRFGFNLNLSKFDPGPATEPEGKPADKISSTPSYSSNDLERQDPRDKLWEDDLRRLTMWRNLGNASGTFLNAVLKGSRIRAGIPIGTDLNEPPPNPLDDEIARRQDFMTHGERGMIGKLTGAIPPPGTSLSRFRAIQPLIQESLQAKERAAAAEDTRAFRREQAATGFANRQMLQAQTQAFTGKRDDLKAARDEAIRTITSKLVNSKVATRNAIGLLRDTKSSIGDVATQGLIPRAFLEVGNLAGPEQARFRYRMGIKGIYDAAGQFVTGLYTEGHRRELIEALEDLQRTTRHQEIIAANGIARRIAANGNIDIGELELQLPGNGLHVIRDTGGVTMVVSRAQMLQDLAARPGEVWEVGSPEDPEFADYEAYLDQPAIQAPK